MARRHSPTVPGPFRTPLSGADDLCCGGVMVVLGSADGDAEGDADGDADEDADGDGDGGAARGCPIDKTGVGSQLSKEQLFKSLPTDCKKVWGVYVIVLEKLGSRRRIYIDRGTQLRHGIGARLNR
ncbi:hypothetical protein BKA56DRAFT_619946 [Ilyonectria sp. MPI-CAGE-AT-0026]|nr:hypothetical protein BKA56DRAFT_619946 [Ilyonectria sp. MPI-CAGE-AT-0026]